MIANYHTHTWRCRHASGTEREYVESAIAAGMKILGFSDHSPQCFPGGYRSTFRMDLDQLDDYCSTVMALRDEMKDRIDIHLGLEMEYYPISFPKLLTILRDTPVEYAVLGQHYLGSEINDHYVGWATEDEHLLARYCAQVRDAMNTGAFTYFAHPDLMRFEGENRIYRDYMRTLCREANACHMPVELNLLGLSEGRHYPAEKFWKIAAEENCQVILACDAHRADALNQPETERKGREFLQKFGMTPIDTVALRPVRI